MREFFPTACLITSPALTLGSTMPAQGPRDTVETLKVKAVGVATRAGADICSWIGDIYARP
ncbi:hypothetical protein N9L47_02195 [Rhodobacteraceae bacterium]|nr:hypothetical protein [Paracoccaceae bacterium]